MQKLEKEIDFKNNDKLSDFSGKDLQRLIYLLNDYKLSYRDNINIDSTFGIEIEANKLGMFGKNAICEEVNNKTNYLWSVSTDNSLNNGLEVKSPILIDTHKSWEDVKIVNNYLYEKGVIGNECGGHIHIGSNILNYEIENLLNLFELWSAYEHIIFRYSSNDRGCLRNGYDIYAKSCTNNYLEYLEKLNKNIKYRFLDIIGIVQEERKYALNLKNIKCAENNDKNTIEIRIPNGTLNAVIWQNNINFFTKLLNYTKSDKYDLYTIKNRLELSKELYNESVLSKYYNYIFLEDSLELCDLIFDNNMDKIYFLKQYLKNFKENEEFNKTYNLTLNK